MKTVFTGNGCIIPLSHVDSVEIPFGARYTNVKTLGGHSITLHNEEGISFTEQYLEFLQQYENDTTFATLEEIEAERKAAEQPNG